MMFGLENELDLNQGTWYRHHKHFFLNGTVYIAQVLLY